MKIYFCDGCNESIPLVDVQSAQVTTIKGKLFCRTCIPPGALAGPAAARSAPSRGRTSPALMILVLALVGWTGWRDREVLLGLPPAVDEGALQQETATDDLRRRLSQVEGAQFGLSSQGEAQGKELAGLAGTLQAARAEGQARDKALTNLGDEVTRFTIAQSAVSQLVERVQMNANKLSTVELRVDALSQALAGQEARLAAGAAAGAVLAASAASPMSTASAAPAAPAVDPARMALLETIRRQLLDPEVDRRFDGVDQVERGNYRELSADLIPLLQDEDMWVRLYAMNVLGNFGYEGAVPSLFDVLEDSNATIRKTAAENLVRLTGFDPGFDAKGSAGDRGKAVKKWREWFDQRGA